MANLRIVYDNALARAASLTASTTAGALAASKLLLDIKSEVHRAIGTSVTYTATWAATEILSCVAIPFCNLSPTATMRVRIYSDTAGTTLVYDSSVLLACPAAAITLRGWTAAAASSAYAYGGGACARAWFAAIGGRKLVVDIVDTANLQGYIEASRLIVGDYWSPISNADVGVRLVLMDTSAHFRSAASDLLTDIGTRSRKVILDLSQMPPADRDVLTNILRGNGMAYPIFLSLLPGHSDYQLERDYTVYAKLSVISAIVLQSVTRYSTPIELDEI